MKLQRPGSDSFTPMEAFLPDVEIASGRAHLRRRFGGSYAAQGGGRRAVSSASNAANASGRLAVFPSPLHLLVEWRLFFPPGQCAYREAVALLRDVRGVPWKLRRTKWLRPRRRRGAREGVALDLIAFSIRCLGSSMQKKRTSLLLPVSSGSDCKMFCVNCRHVTLYPVV